MTFSHSWCWFQCIHRPYYLDLQIKRNNWKKYKNFEDSSLLMTKNQGLFKQSKQKKISHFRHLRWIHSTMNFSFSLWKQKTKRLEAVTTATDWPISPSWLPALTSAIRDKETTSFTRDRFVCCVLIWQPNVLFVFGGWEGWAVQKWKTWPKVIWSLDSALIKYKAYYWTSSKSMRGEVSQTNKTKNNNKKLIQKDPCWRLKMDLYWKVNPETLAQGTTQTELYPGLF